MKLLKRIAFYTILALIISALWVGLAFADDGALTLEQGLAWVLGGGGAGVLTYFIVGKVPFLKKQEPDYKRYWSIGIVVVLAACAWGLTMLMGYSPVPTTWRAGIEMAFSVMFVALTSSQIMHGAIDLRQKRLNGF